MRPARTACGVGLALALGCTSDLRLSLEGKACRSTPPRCLPGFVCDERSNLCVRTLPDAADGGAPNAQGGAGGGGAGGAAGGGGGAGGGSDGGGGLPESGAGGVGTGGSGGHGGSAAEPPDASSDASPEGGCAALTLYPDRDGDGVGVTAEASVRCPEPGWVAAPGDCRDDLAPVHPGQSEYFGTGFPDPLAPEGISFDYDCSGDEDPDPSNTPPGTPPNCAQLVSGVNCTGGGYLPALPARSGEGLEPRCGSNRLRTCVMAQLLTCSASDVTLEARFRCK